MRAAVGLAALVLVACADGEPTATFSRTRECTDTPTADNQYVQRQGACLVWSKVGNVRTCAMYSHYRVRQYRHVLTCTRDEWVDDREG